jgi:uncharacterized membrane protein YeaQ/YmgE (transglycosylase-associated protein family)
LLLANLGKETRPEPLIAKISQETLARMIGTTRARFFMNKVRKLGFISYNGRIEAHSSWLNVVLRDQPHRLPDRRMFICGRIELCRRNLLTCSEGRIGRPQIADRKMHMSGESLAIILVVGLIAGWLAGQIWQGSGFGLVGDLVIGVLGAFIGSWLLPQLGIHLGSGLLAAIINATIGALVLLFLISLVGGRRSWGRRL